MTMTGGEQPMRVPATGQPQETVSTPDRKPAGPKWKPRQTDKKRIEKTRMVVTRDVLAGRLAQRAEISVRAAREEVQWFFDTMSSALQRGDEVRIHGFGSFSTAQRAARPGRDPRTGEPLSLPPRRVVRFVASTSLSAALKSRRQGYLKR